jgi:hypothetical protein
MFSKENSFKSLLSIAINGFGPFKSVKKVAKEFADDTRYATIDEKINGVIH